MTQIMVLIYTDITRRDFVSVCWASGSRNWITAYLTEINYFDALQYLLSFLRWFISHKHIWFFPWMHRSPSHWRTVSNIHLFTHQETWFRIYDCIGYSFNYCQFQNTLLMVWGGQGQVTPPASTQASVCKLKKCYQAI